MSIPRERIGVFHQLYGKGDSMLRDIFSSKAVLAGFTFFVVMVGSSLLYMQHVKRQVARELPILEGAEKLQTQTPNTEAIEVESVDKDTDEYDWQTDIDLEMPAEEVWARQDTDQNTDQQPEPTKNIKGNSEQYPPKDWYKTEDTELYYVYYQAQLIKQFGDIKQVKTVVDTEYKIAKDIELGLDEQIEYLEAQNYLWPDQRTQASLNYLIKIKYRQSDDHSHDHPHPH